jgi:uncharacterized membrane protein
MESKAKLLGHPIHPMLIVFPLGLLGMAVVFDLIASIAGDWGELARAAWYMIAAGIIAGWLAIGVDPGAHLDAPSSLSGRATGRRERAAAA